MKKYTLLFFFCILCSLNAFSQKNMAIGVRLGDPTGGTFKKYLDNNSALEFNFGAPTYLLGGYDYDYYYNDKYNRPGYWNYSHKTKFRYALQAHYLKAFDIKAVDGLQWYAGGGLQFRQIMYEYSYRDINGYYYTENVVDTDFGVDVAGGGEYTFDGVPFSVFAEVNMFFNFVGNGFFYLQPGIGGRYNF